MMRHGTSGSPWSGLTATAALILSAAWVVAWLLGFLAPDGGLTMRIAQLGVGLVLAVGLAAGILPSLEARRLRIADALRR